MNPHTDKEYTEQVFADDGSSSLVVRRIAMDLDDWERLDRTSREQADRLNEWTTHIGSAVYWIPPGTAASADAAAGRDAYWGETVLAGKQG